MATMYCGERGVSGAKVHKTVSGYGSMPLNPRFDVRRHSPDGFEWGYGGSGPAQLALAILLDSVDRYEAEALYQYYKFAVVANWGGDRWTLTQEEVRSWVRHFIQNNDRILTEIEALRQYDSLTLGEQLP